MTHETSPFSPQSKSSDMAWAIGVSRRLSSIRVTTTECFAKRPLRSCLVRKSAKSSSTENGVNGAVTVAMSTLIRILNDLGTIQLPWYIISTSQRKLLLLCQVPMHSYPHPGSPPPRGRGNKRIIKGLLGVAVKPCAAVWSGASGRRGPGLVAALAWLVFAWRQAQCGSSRPYTSR